MANSTLFIPDISGFTRFVKSTEITHSQHIIKELLTLIIKEGSKHFEVAEIEGDAVFFYKYNKKFSVEEIQAISKKIYVAFNQHLLKYEHQRICSCGACSTAIDLQLKFVVHSGEIALTKFGNEKPKPFGSDVIILHRLLKNDLTHKEYILFTDSFIGEEKCEMDGEACYKEADLGNIPYQYLLIDKWKEDIKLVEEKDTQIETDIEVEVSQDIDYPTELIHEFISDFKYRHFWNKEADEIIYNEEQVNRAGTEHYCIVNGNNFYFDTLKLKVDERMEAYGEVLKNPMAPFKYFEIDFLMISKSENATDFHVKLKASLKWKLLFPLIPFIRKKMTQQAHSRLKEIVDSVKEHIKDGVIYA